MKSKMMILGAALLATASFGAVETGLAAPLAVAGVAVPDAAQARGDEAFAGMIVKTQGRRIGGARIGGGRIGGGRVGGGRVGAFGGRRGWRGGGGLSPGAAIGIGVGAAALGILGAAAAAGAAEGPGPVYGRCYIVRQPVYDDWGNYLGRRRVRVCN